MEIIYQIEKHNYSVDKYYDMQCAICAYNRSTDFERGLETNIKRLRILAKREGWTVDSNGCTICPNCSAKSRRDKFR